MLNKNVWIQTRKILLKHLEPLSPEETQELDEAFSARQKEVSETLRKLQQALQKRRSRAKGKDDEEHVRWEVGFDLERLSKGGGLQDIDEIAPFVDCKDLSEYLTTTRRFARAFRTEEFRTEDCKDIQAGETINEFILRVQKLWYSAPLKTVMHLVRLDNCEFDDDLGFKRDVPVDWDNDWTPVPGSDVSLTAEEIAALPMVGKPEPEWKKAGFSCYADWKEEVDKQERKRKGREQLERSLRNKEEVDRDLKSRPDETKTPTLL